MGCCLSSADNPPPQKTHNPHFQDNRAPPPVIVDEETVKEVLSETPIPPPPPPLSPRHHTTTVNQPPPPLPLQQPKPNLEQVKKPNTALVRPELPERHKYENATEILDDMSEISSLKSDSEVAVVQPSIVKRVSPRKLYGYGRGRVVGQSPTRRQSPSPGRRAVSVTSPGGRRVGSREPGQNLGRRSRSRSPATRVHDNRGGSVSRSGSANRRYPGRVEVESSGYLTRKRAEEPKPEEGKWAGDESLDNPLVSLECFIFL